MIVGDKQLPTILFLDRVPLLGGAERILLLSMQRAAACGARPLLACPPVGRLPDAARAMGFQVLPCGFNRMRRTYNPLALIGYASGVIREGRRVERLCREHDVSLLHPHGPVAAAYAARTARRLGLPMVVHVHDALPPTRFYAAAVRYAASAGAHFICVSNAVRAMLRQIGVPEGRMHTVYNAIGPAFLGPPPDPAPEVQGPGPHIGLFALIWPLKGQHVFLQAAERLAGRYPTARFHIVGSLAYSDYQPYLDRLHAMSESTALKGRVTFTGFREDIPRWMAAMDVVAHASVEPESFALVVAEAMALGKPVVATNIGGTTEIIEDGRTGRLVPPEDPEALAGALSELLAVAPDDPMRERAAASVRQRFSPERFGEELTGVYETVMAGRLTPVGPSR